MPSLKLLFVFIIILKTLIASSLITHFIDGKDDTKWAQKVPRGTKRRGHIATFIQNVSSLAPIAGAAGGVHPQDADLQA